MKRGPKRQRIHTDLEYAMLDARDALKEEKLRGADGISIDAKRNPLDAEDFEQALFKFKKKFKMDFDPKSIEESATCRIYSFGYDCDMCDKQEQNLFKIAHENGEFYYIGMLTVCECFN